MTTKTILITGGSGFLGSHLVKNLLLVEPNIRICILDNFITSSKRNLNELTSKFPDQIDIFQVDITKTNDLQFLIDLYPQIDEIYHMASIASPPLYSKFPLETLEVGYTGTKNLLDLIVKHYPLCKFLFASSSEVYGQPLVHPQSESYYGNVNPYGNRSNYDESKRVGETLCWIYNKHYMVNTRIVRIFNTYGPGMNLDDGRIITEIVKSHIKGTTLCIFGDGNQTRCFNWVDDTIDGILTVMKSNYALPVNVGSENEISINKLIQIFQKVTGQILDVEYSLIDKDDPLKRKPDLTTLKKLNPNLKQTSLEYGLQEILLSFKIT
jgi:nucleoside-diphosphate-sugar epimerase